MATMSHTGCGAYANGVDLQHLPSASRVPPRAYRSKVYAEPVGVLVWWLLPLLATVAAIVWLWWQGHTGAGEPGQMRSTKELERMRRAMEKPLPQKVERNTGAPVSPAPVSSVDVSADRSVDSDSGAA